MFTDNHSPLIAALLLPGIYFICQAMALVMRLTLGHVRHPSWRIGVAIAAVLYTLVLSAHVTSLEHTFSSAAPAAEAEVARTPSPAPEMSASDRELMEALMNEPTDCGFSSPDVTDFLPPPISTQKPELKGKPNEPMQPRRIDPYPSAG